MRRVRASVVLLILTAMASAAILLLPSVRMSSVPTETPAKVALAAVEMGEIRQETALRGTIRYALEYAAIAPVTGMVAEVYVSPGEHVAKGQALLRMDSTAEAAAIARAYASQDTAEGLAEGVDIEGLTETALSERLALLEAMTLRAAADGQVIDVPVGQYGGLLAGSTAVLLCGEEQQIVCMASVSDAAELSPGMLAEVFVRGEQYCMATVGHIGAAQVDALTGQTVCQVTMTPDRDISLPIGAAVEVEVERFACTSVPVIPVTALSSSGTVWVVSEERCWEVDAEVYRQDDMRCWVNLPEGTNVIDRPEGLINGQRIREVQP